MAIGSLALNTTVTTTGSAAGDLRAGATPQPRVMEMGVNLGATTASTYGLIKANSSGTQTSPVVLQNEDPNGPAMIAGSAVAWSAAPTIAGSPVYYRRVGLPGTIGVGIIWTFPRGLVILVSTALLFWNLATNSASTNFWFVADE